MNAIRKPTNLKNQKRNMSDYEKWKINPNLCVKCGNYYIMKGTKMCVECCGEWHCDNCNAWSRHKGIESMCDGCGQLKPNKKDTVSKYYITELLLKNLQEKYKLLNQN